VYQTARRPPWFARAGSGHPAVMVHINRTFTVDSPRREVFEYLRDFANAQEWDPGTVSCTRIGPEPVGLGTTWRNVSKVLGRETELTYELTRQDPDHLQFTGKNKTATSTDDIGLAEGDAPGTTRITYDANIELHGPAVLVSPIMKVAFERIGNETEDSLKRVFGR
jgi:carbon monoxide dehydrogenase subunit G